MCPFFVGRKERTSSKRERTFARTQFDRILMGYFWMNLGTDVDQSDPMDFSIHAKCNDCGRISVNALINGIQVGGSLIELAPGGFGKLLHVAWTIKDAQAGLNRIMPSKALPAWLQSDSHSVERDTWASTATPVPLAGLDVQAERASNSATLLCAVCDSKGRLMLCRAAVDGAVVNWYCHGWCNLFAVLDPSTNASDRVLPSTQSSDSNKNGSVTSIKLI